MVGYKIGTWFFSFSHLFLVATSLETCSRILGFLLALKKSPTVKGCLLGSISMAPNSPPPSPFSFAEAAALTAAKATANNFFTSVTGFWFLLALRAAAAAAAALSMESCRFCFFSRNSAYSFSAHEFKVDIQKWNRRRRRRRRAEQKEADEKKQKKKHNSSRRRERHWLDRKKRKSVGNTLHGENNTVVILVAHRRHTAQGCGNARIEKLCENTQYFFFRVI